MELSFGSCILSQDGSFSTEHLVKGDDNESMRLAKSQWWESAGSTQLANIAKASNDTFCKPNNIDTSITFNSYLTILDSPSPLAL